MPSPFIGRRGQANTGSQPDDRPQPITPQMEHIAHADEMNPYRGIDTHGVPNVVEPFLVPGYDGEMRTQYIEPEVEPEPVPVRIVTRGGREKRDWRVVRGAVGTSQGQGQQTNATRILGANDARTKATVKNLGAVRLWIGKNESLTQWMGYPIEPNAERDLGTIGEVWGISDDGTQQPFAIIVEFSIKE